MKLTFIELTITDNMERNTYLLILDNGSSFPEENKSYKINYFCESDIT